MCNKRRWGHVSSDCRRGNVRDQTFYTKAFRISLCIHLLECSPMVNTVLDISECYWAMIINS